MHLFFTQVFLISQPKGQPCSFRLDSIATGLVAQAINTTSTLKPGDIVCDAARLNGRTEFGPWEVSLPAASGPTLKTSELIVRSLPKGQTPEKMVTLTVTESKGRGENTNPTTPAHNKKNWFTGSVSAEAAANHNVVAGLGKAFRKLGLINPKAKVCKTKLDVLTCQVHTNFDDIVPPSGVSLDETLESLRMPLPFTIQQEGKVYNYTFRRISPGFIKKLGCRCER